MGKLAARTSLLLLLALWCACPLAAQSRRPGLKDLSGGLIPPDLVLRNESGRSMTLGELWDKPVLLTLVYYSCEHLCPQFLGALAESLSLLGPEAGRDYRMLTVSFDDTDNPESARAAKRNYLRAAGGRIPEGAWSFLTGDREAVNRLCAAVGLDFSRAGHGFFHPEALIFLAPGGRICGYQSLRRYPSGGSYRVAFSPAELGLALGEASAGRILPARLKEPAFCFPAEREIELRFFRMLKLVGGLNLAAVAGVFVWLVVYRRRGGKGRV